MERDPKTPLTRVWVVAQVSVVLVDDVVVEVVVVELLVASLEEKILVESSAATDRVRKKLLRSSGAQDKFDCVRIHVGKNHWSANWACEIFNFGAGCGLVAREEAAFSKSV